MRRTTWCLGIMLSVGCVDPSMLDGNKMVGDAGEEAAPAAADPGANAPADPGAPAPVKESGFSKLDWKLVNYQEAMKDNPNLVEVENKINAVDPLSAATQSYFSLGSRVHLAAFKHSIDLHKAQYEKNPTFEEFEAMLRQSNVDLQALYPWQAYAYNAEEGTIVILEDRAEKRRMHEERGLEAPAD